MSGYSPACDLISASLVDEHSACYCLCWAWLLGCEVAHLNHLAVSSGVAAVYALGTLPEDHAECYSPGLSGTVCIIPCELGSCDVCVSEGLSVGDSVIGPACEVGVPVL